MHSNVQLSALPAFTDNYIWMLDDGHQAWVVDPGDAAPVQQALQARRLVLSGILVTHHHPDHVGGLAQLRPLCQGPIYAPARERMPVPTEPLHEGLTVEVLGKRFEVLELPGHTAGHIAYVEQVAQDQSDAAPILFCGDTLFSAGCGRLFEGTAEQMQHSLAKLAKLPAATQVCCTHEYTLSNMRFALAVEPGNPALHAHQTHCKALREAGQMTLPSRMGLELQINPFLRCTEPEVVSSALAQGAQVPQGGSQALAVFTALREWKNRF